MAAVSSDEELSTLEVEVGEFLPDVIAHAVTEPVLTRLRELAPGAKFMPDFKHDLMRARR